MRLRYHFAFVVLFAGSANAAAQHGSSSELVEEEVEETPIPVPSAAGESPSRDALTRLEARIAHLEARLREVENPPLDEPEEAEASVEGAVPASEASLMSAHSVDSAAVRFVPGKGLELTSADGRFQLRTRVRVQFRWTGQTGVDGDEGWAQQFRLRRARVAFGGHAFSEDVRFGLELALSPNDVGVQDNLSGELEGRPRLAPLLSFYVDFRPFRDLEIRIGQYKISSNRQRVISSGNLQLVDRALLNGEFTLDRDVGFDLRSRDFLGLERLRYYAGVYIARGRDSQGFDDFGMLYLARLEYLPFGLFNDYSETDFERSGPRLSLGFGWAHIDRARANRGILGAAPSDGGTTDTQHIYADALLKMYGFSLLSEFAYRHGRRNPGPEVEQSGEDVELPRNGFGWHLQAGYLIPRIPLELAARYGFLRAQGDSSLQDREEIVGAVSYYAARHPYKVQLDYARLWRSTMGSGEHRIRLQLQVSL